MEVQINPEIKDYKETVFFGLTLRQVIFSACSVGAAVGLYFLLKPYLGIETLSWVCIVGAAPFAALGFVNYNGMNFEQFVWVWLKSEVLTPKKLVYIEESDNPNIKKKKKGRKIRYERNNQ